MRHAMLILSVRKLKIIINNALLYGYFSFLFQVSFCYGYAQPPALRSGGISKAVQIELVEIRFL